MIGNDAITLQVWDTAGQEKYKGLSKIFYRGTDFCFLVFDLSNKKTFHNINNWKQSCIDSNSYLEKGGILPFILLGNKSDLENHDVSKEEIKNFCQENDNIKYFEVSAKNGTQIDVAFHEAAIQIMNYKNMYSK